MRRSSSPTVCALASVLLAASCSPAPAQQRSNVASAPSTSGSTTPANPGALSSNALAEMAGRMAARRACVDTCCVGEMPAGYARAWPDNPDTQHAAELRGILDAPASPAAHALAALWLARALDVGDLPRLAQCIDSTEPAGVFPIVSVSQMARQCETVHWEEKTLGRACMDAIGNIVAQEFAQPADVRAWMSTHGSPLDSYDYWQRIVSLSRPASDELLERLHHHNAELYFRVAALNPDALGTNAEPIFARVAHDDIGGDRILRLLRKQDTWPELDSPERFATFATTVLRRAERIFEPRSAPELLALWENRGCCPEDYVRADLAVAVSRLAPDQSRRVLKATLAELAHAQAPVLEELARLHAAQEQASLQSWFLGPEAIRAGNQDDLAAAILRGLKDAAPASRPVLASLLRGKAPSAESHDAVEALMAAAIAVGYPAPEECRGYLFARGGKGSTRAEWDAADREARARRTTCMQDARRWLGTR